MQEQPEAGGLREFAGGGGGVVLSSHLWLPPGCTVNRGLESDVDRGQGI